MALTEGMQPWAEEPPSFLVTWQMLPVGQEEVL